MRRLHEQQHVRRGRASWSRRPCRGRGASAARNRANPSVPLTGRAPRDGRAARAAPSASCRWTSPAAGREARRGQLERVVRPPRLGREHPGAQARELLLEGGGAPQRRASGAFATGRSRRRRCARAALGRGRRSSRRSCSARRPARRAGDRRRRAARAGGHVTTLPLAVGPRAAAADRFPGAGRRARCRVRARSSRRSTARVASRSRASGDRAGRGPRRSPGTTSVTWRSSSGSRSVAAPVPVAGRRRMPRRAGPPGLASSGAKRSVSPTNTGSLSIRLSSRPARVPVGVQQCRREHPGQEKAQARSRGSASS